MFDALIDVAIKGVEAAGVITVYVVISKAVVMVFSWLKELK